jgi:hypothetical protein
MTTPATGPWKLDDHMPDTFIVNVHGERIARTFDVVGQAANTRLIAAAPELLAALKEFRRLYETAPFKNTIYSHLGSNTYELWRKAGDIAAEVEAQAEGRADRKEQV